MIGKIYHNANYEKLIYVSKIVQMAFKSADSTNILVPLTN